MYLCCYNLDILTNKKFNIMLQTNKDKGKGHRKNQGNGGGSSYIPTAHKVEKGCKIIDGTVAIQDPHWFNSPIATKSDLILSPFFFLEIEELDKKFARYPYYKVAVKEAMVAMKEVQFKRSLSKSPIALSKTTKLYSFNHEKDLVINKNDRIGSLKVFIEYLRKKGYTKIAYVTKDTHRAAELITLGVLVEDYENDQVNEIPSSMVYIDKVPSDIKCKEYKKNMYFLLPDGNTYFWNQHRLQHLHIDAATIMGIAPKNQELFCLMHALLDPHIRMITVSGPFGSGKTFSPVLAAMKLVAENIYNKFIVSRTMVAVEGEEVGILPGTAEEKIADYLVGVFDNIDNIIELTKKYNQKSETTDASNLQSNKKAANRQKKEAAYKQKEQSVARKPELDFEFMQKFKSKVTAKITGLMRGASMGKSFIFIDESENLFRSQARLIASRVGSTSKIIFAGDNSQIDHPHLDARSNGFTRLIKHYETKSYAVHIVLKETERSDIAKDATSL